MRHDTIETKEVLILNSVFRQLTDSIIFYRQFPPPPPPVQEYQDKFDSMDFKRMDEYDKLYSFVDKDRNVISVTDSLLPSTLLMREAIEKYRADTTYNYFFGAFDSFIAKNKGAIHLDINKINDTGKYELQHQSEILKQYNHGEPVFKFNYFGNLTFTRVYLDKEEKSGFFDCNLHCGQDCHFEFLILIRLYNDKWRIEKINQIAIS